MKNKKRSIIQKDIVAFHQALLRDKHHRYRSWGHCYRYFRRIRLGKEILDIDLAALQLGFYLASWGMYRGASFLLWKDYKIHKYAIKELFRDKYDELWHLDYAKIRNREHTAILLLKLSEKLRSIYISHVKIVNNKRQQVKVTDTLVSKILLGTMACTPAYDEFVRYGLSIEHIPYSYLNERHILALWEFCKKHDREFRVVQKRIQENGLKYPVMKLADMYFWMRGKRAAARWGSR